MNDRRSKHVCIYVCVICPFLIVVWKIIVTYIFAFRYCFPSSLVCCCWLVCHSDASIQSQDRRTLRKFSCSLAVWCFSPSVSWTIIKFSFFFPSIKIRKYFCPSGGLVLASIDQVPDELIDNAIVLGCLSFFVAFVFLIDMSEKMGKRRTDSTQTDTSSIDRHFTKSQSMTTINSQANLMDSDDNGKNRDSMRSTNTQREISTQQTQQNQQSLNPFVNHQQNGEQRHQPLSHEQSFHVHYPEGSQPPQSIRSTQHFPTTTYSEDVVETQTLPTAQTAVFSKVKQPPTLINHFETEPYKKILSRTNQPVPVVYTRYHDPAQHHNDPSFYDDFNDYRKQTYYQGPKVDQGKLVIRDYSHQPTQQQKHACNCPNHHDDETEGNEQNNVTIKSGYVSQVAKLWDNRMKSNEGSVRIHQKDIRGLNTVV